MLKRSAFGALALVVGNGAFALDLVNGGGFESPVIPTGVPYILNVTPTGWVGTGDLAVQGYAGAMSSGDGNQWFDLNPGINAGTGLSQTIDLLAGVPYTLAFIYNGGGGGSTLQIAYAVTTSAQTLLAGTVSTAALDVYSGSQWSSYAGSFVSPTNTTATLSFLPNGSYSGGFIDAVSVSAVPEPSTAGMMLIACLALFARRRLSR